MLKQIYELSPSDFEQFPVWVFITEDDEDAQDEWTVRGSTVEALDQTALFVLKAHFKCSGGLEVPGFLVPASNLWESQPCAFFQGRPMTFWSGIVKPTQSDVADFYNRVGLSSHEVFPICWSCDRVGENHPTSGEIAGFGFFDGQGETCFIK